MSLAPLEGALTRLIRVGRLGLIDAGGRRYDFGSPDAAPRATARFHDSRVKWGLAFRPGIALGEAYVDGRVTVEEGSLRDLLHILLASQDLAMRGSRLYAFRRRMQRLLQKLPAVPRLGRAARNVRHHYDVGQALYERFLDTDLQYSCAYWREGTTSLEHAQRDKKRHIAGKLLLDPGMSVLDIGSGWGGMALQLARDHGVTVTGLTLSRDQHEVSMRRAREAGLADRVTFKLLDYRKERGTYDRVVSIGMFEHVGRRGFRPYFRHLNRLLTPDGVALIHTIGKTWDPGPGNAWMRKYIFPGGYLPTLSEVLPIVEHTGLFVTDIENWRLHYARTLRAWDERFQAHRAEIAAMFDERFCRMWEFYLQGCEASFIDQEVCVFQLQLAKNKDAVPITRDYMYAGRR